MRIVVALPAAVEESLLPALLAARHEIVARPGGAVELASVLESLRPDAALIHASPRGLGAAVVEAIDRVGVRAIVFADTPAEQAVAASLGVREVVASDSPWTVVAGLLDGDGAADAAVEPPPEETHSEVVAVWGPAGAPGRSTTALTLASELARSGRRVALVDADPYGGAIAPMLGLLDEAPGFAAACRLAGTGGLDLAQLDRIAVPVPVGDGILRVLTGLTRPSRWTELSSDRVAAALEAMRGWADAIVVDTGFSLESDEEIMSDVLAPRRNAATLTVLRAADRVVVVGAADPVSLARLIRGYDDLLTLVPAEHVDVVVTKVRRGVIGLDARGQVTASLERFAGIRPAAMVPWDSAYDTALAAAQPLCVAAPKSPARAALAGYTRDRFDVGAAESGRRPFRLPWRERGRMGA